MSTVHVRNLPVDVEEHLLRRIFADYGPLESITLVRNGPPSPRASSECFLELRDRQRAVAAVRRLNGQYFRGMLLQVEHRRRA